MRKFLFYIIVFISVILVSLKADENCCPNGFNPGTNTFHYNLDGDCIVIVSYCLEEDDNNPFTLPDIYICSLTYFGVDCVENTSPPSLQLPDWNEVILDVVFDNLSIFSLAEWCDQPEPLEKKIRVYNGGCYQFFSGLYVDENGNLREGNKCTPCDDQLKTCIQWYTICRYVENGQGKYRVQSGPITPQFQCTDPCIHICN